MNILAKFRDALTKDAAQPVTLPDALVFSSLDVHAISKNIDLVQKGKLDGESNIPDSQATTLSATEALVVSSVLNESRANVQNYDAHQRAYQNRIASLDPFSVAAKFRVQVDMLKVELQAEIDQESGKLFLVRQSLMAIEEDWKTFKKKWNIEHEPMIGLSLSAKRWILAGLILVEAVSNSILLRPHMEFGLLEAFVVALIFPVLTLLGAAYPTGVAIRRLLRPGVVKHRILTIIGCLPLILGAIFTNLLLAYIRESALIDGDPERGFEFTIQAITFSGAPPLSMLSLLMFFFSTLLLVFAIIDVFKMDYVIPGLRDKILHRIEKHQEYSQKLKDAHGRLMALQKSSIGIAKDLLDKLGIWNVEHNQIQDMKLRLWQKLQNYLDHIESITNTLLGQYRQENLATRSDPAPAYFSTLWVYPELSLRVPIDSERDLQYPEKLKQAQLDIESAQKSLSEVFNQIPGILKGIDGLLHEVEAK